MLFFFLANIINNWIQFIDTDNNRILFSSSIVCWKCMVCLRVECLWAEACQWSTTAIVAKTPFGQLCKRKFRLCVNFIAFFFNVYYVASSLLFYCKILLTCVRVAAIRQPSAHIQKLKTKRQTLAQRERERERQRWTNSTLLCEKRRQTTWLRAEILQIIQLTLGPVRLANWEPSQLLLTKAQMNYKWAEEEIIQLQFGKCLVGTYKNSMWTLWAVFLRNFIQKMR